MQAAEKFEFYGQTLWLSTCRCIYWQEEKTLIISDSHFGKTGHFRKNGINIPQKIYLDDLHNLLNLVLYFAPEQLIVVGDMFHSHANKEMDLFLRRRNDISQLKINLVSGNHDILCENFYKEAGIEIIKGVFDLGPFSFVHDIADVKEALGKTDKYFFSGHIHPGISLKGLGKQSLRFSCFYFGKQFAVLPAFGKFNGASSIKTQIGDTVFAIMPEDLKNNQAGKVFKV